jgi:hypothetical protein
MWPTIATVSHSTQWRGYGSTAVCRFTSELADAPDFRLTIEPKPKNGSRLKSQAMADKPVTVTREQTGRFGNQDMARLGIALAPALAACGLAMLQSGRRTAQSASCCRRLDAAFSDTRQRYRAKSYSGAPWSMKMGTTRSPFPYDAAARHALQSAKLRYLTSLHYALRALPAMARAGPVRPKTRRL